MRRLTVKAIAGWLADHWLIALVLAAFLALALCYSLASPLYEPTDELRHFRYVRHIVAYRELPVQGAGARAQSHHPPLYYALGALTIWCVPISEEVYYEPPGNPYWGYRYWEVSDDNKNQYIHGAQESSPFQGIVLGIYLVRWLTVMMGAGALWLTYCIGREIAPDLPLLAAGGAALVALNPQFLYLSGAVNNDIPATLCSVSVMLVCVRVLTRGPRLRADVMLGVLVGLSLLTKLNLLALLGLVVLVHLYSARRSQSLWVFLRGCLVAVVLAVLIAGWWFWRNQVLYGDLTGVSKVNELWSGTEPSESWWNLWQSLPYLWSSLWGRFGFGQVPLPQPVYQALLAMCTVGLAGHLVPRRRRTPVIARSFLVVTCLAFTGVVFYYILIQPAGAMGRFLFPAMPAFALLVVLGLSRLVPRRLAWVVGPVVAAAMCAVACYALLGVLNPAFARPRQVGDRELARISGPLDIELGDLVRLVGYEVSSTSAAPGGELAVKIYWEALRRADQNYVVFVHLLSDEGPMVAQRDTYPGLGRYPTIAWEPGRIFADTYRLHIPETAYSPDTGYLQVGMYLPEGPRLTTRDGRDAVRLEAVRISPLPGRVPNPLQANFGDQFLLAGYTFDRRTARPGETVGVTLYWQALVPIGTNYSVFAHILGVQDQVWGRDDGWPGDGDVPTSQWPLGEVIEDDRELKVGLTTPPGFYDVEVGLYDADGHRLPVLAEDGHWLGKRVLLSTIQVLEP
jgi:4-amino-4-deoxy-L-arabinose transferase-like glycosyltransferase